MYSHFEDSMLVWERTIGTVSIQGFRMRDLITSAKGTCSVAATYKPPMLVPRVRPEKRLVPVDIPVKPDFCLRWSRLLKEMPVRQNFRLANAVGKNAGPE